jgi:cytochrome c553
LAGEPATGISAVDADAVAAGREGSMTCQACHGQDGVAPRPEWPNLAGQHVSYLLQSMRQYRSGERTNAVMAPLVGSLDDETLEALAAFYAAQPGLYSSGR